MTPIWLYYIWATLLLLLNGISSLLNLSVPAWELADRRLLRTVRMAGAHSGRPRR